MLLNYLIIIHLIYIQKTITILDWILPSASIKVVEKLVLSKNEVWDKKRILESLNNEAEYLKEEAARNYPAPSRNK